MNTVQPQTPPPAAAEPADVASGSDGRPASSESSAAAVSADSSGPRLHYRAMAHFFSGFSPVKE